MEFLRVLRNISSRFSLPNIRFNLTDGINEEPILVQILDNINSEYNRIEALEDE